MQHVNTKNWTYCRFLKGNVMAMISFGASPESVALDRLDYYVTVLEDEEKEIFQKEFSSLNEACFYLNEHYGDWDFEDQTAPKSGCSSCSAH